MIRFSFVKVFLVTGLTAVLLWLPGQTFADTPPATDEPVTNIPQSASTTGTADQPASTADGSTAENTSQTTAQANQTNQNEVTNTSNSTDTPGAGSPDTSAGTSGTQTSINDSTNPTAASNQTADSTSTAGITNNLDSGAQSGDASVTDSQKGGDATSGDAAATATLVNLVQSSIASGSQNSQPTQFTYNITNDHSGDIILDPAAYLIPSQSGANPTQGSQSNVQTISSIDNYLNLIAASGDATVADNFIGGDATSGNALTQANLINLINSSISSNQLFLGFVNIYGTLNGNILLPAGLIDALLGSPTPAGTSGRGASVSNSYDINNQVALLAQSGQATVADNFIGGDATSGNALTDLALYNLINSQITGGNLLLVFVNDFGHWTGMIFGAPLGTDMAAIGGQIQQYSSYAPAFDGTINNTASINNVLYLNSTSGNATVANNRYGGNATSGNAMASADIINILGDQISLTGWLGILFINVFGAWNGSLLSMQPLQPVGNPATGSHTPHASSPGSHHATNHPAKLAVFVYRPTGHSFNLFNSGYINFPDSFSISNPAATHALAINTSPNDITVASAKTRIASPASIAQQTDPFSRNKPQTNWSRTAAAALMTLAVLLLAAERTVSRRR